MGTWQPLGNFKNYLEHHPPTVIFLVCLFTLAVTFISFGAYIKDHEVRNPDVAQDWNQILASLASLKFCVFSNETDAEAVSLDQEHVVASPPLVEHETDGIPSNSSDVLLASTHLSLLVPLALTESSQGRSPASLHTMLLGSELGLKGPAGKETLNLTLLFYSQPELTNSGSGGEITPTITCLRVTAPTYVLPQTPHPPACPVSEEQDSDHSPLRAVISEQRNPSPQHALECFSMDFTPNPSLTVMLSQEERDLAGHHLMLVSACLLSLCGVLCFFWSLSCSKSRRYHGNGLDLQKEPLIDS
ncbi:hypothetical protein MATL_G00063000 [Megalops atlanticus]|uniref:TMEM248/TMEM219 domain-containing protein n=1 Tax=Megalops atlanticus TaxID=7932 RepID=A0A9D3Q7A4_MEGAT|nr:hypothetical protein MATL_G00063000 [Megalops atlanticus]